MGTRLTLITYVVGLALLPMSCTADNIPPTLTDFWNGKARFQLDAAGIGTDISIHFPSVIREGSQMTAYYIVGYRVGEDSRFATGRAVSTDGLTWVNNPGIVLDVGVSQGSCPSWDYRMASFPGVWKDVGTYYLVYEGAGTSPGDIGLATSADGIHFCKSVLNPILTHSTSGVESANIGTPSLHRENGVWYLFYHSFDGTDCRICVATGPSLTNLTKYTGNPIIDTVSNTWESGTIGKRSTIFKEGSHYYLAYEGSTEQPYGSANWSTGLARSTNLLDWTKYPRNPVVPQSIGGFGNDGPEIVKIDCVYYLYVRKSTGGVNALDRYRLGWNPKWCE